MASNRSLYIALSIYSNICRYLLAFVFLFSGLTKGIDPHGTEYKIEDYFMSFGLNGGFIDGFPLFLGMLLAAVEFFVGLCLFFGVNRRFATWMSLAIMGVMTPLTFYIAWVNPVSDCGCFGDVLILTNWQTFAKNVVLLVAVVSMLKSRHYKAFRLISQNTQWLICLYGLLFILVLEFYCLYQIPIADFTAYRNGTDILKEMSLPEGAEQPEFETTFVLEKNGVKREFHLEDYPDSTWNYLETKTKQKKEGYIPPIDDFEMQDINTGEDKTQELLNEKGYTFLLVLSDISIAEEGSFDLINELYDYCVKNEYGFHALTASGEEAIAKWKYETGAEYGFWNADGTMLKTLIRSNPGLVLIKGGVIINKWSRNNLPTEKLTGKLENLPIDKSGESQTSRFCGVILLFLILPLLAIMLLDGVWTGIIWIGNIRKKTKIANL